MRTVNIPTAIPYQVRIGTDLLDGAGEWLRALCACAAAVIVTDDHVAPLYEPAVRRSMERAGIRTETFVIPHGERSKCASQYLALLEFLASHRLTRADAVVALGGGVVGDLAGFAAATYLRGIAFVQIPTTLLAAVDSSVGGKTAIDLKAGKNLAGAFWQPRGVLCDVRTLDTLPPEIFADGCAEVIKYAILWDRGLFAHLKQHGPAFDRAFVIDLCVQMKRDVVAKDEFDRGERQFLNLGHTLGHGVEACSGFAVSHGKAVAIGTAVVSRAAAAKGLCDPETAWQAQALLEQFGLPVRTEFQIDALLDVMLSDKKRRADTVTLVVPEQIGRCRLYPVPVAELGGFLEAGLQ